MPILAPSGGGGGGGGGGGSAPGIKLPAISVMAAFGPATVPLNWTDISAYVRSGTISRPSTRLAGPLYEYQAGTATIVLKNGDGRFDADNLAGPYVGSTGFQTVVKTFKNAGSVGTWMAPDNLVGGSVRCQCWGGGGGGYGTQNSVAGNGAGAGGGGEYAEEPNLAVIGGSGFSWAVGSSGTPGNGGQGGPGGVTSFLGAIEVIANGGQGGQSTGVGGAGGSGSVNSIHFNGGRGGSNPGYGTAGHNGGAGGGGSGCPTSAGRNGGNTVDDGGAPGASALTDGGPGGQGGGLGTNGHRPVSGPGGGGGGSWANSISVSLGGPGEGGQIRLTYVIAITVGTGNFLTGQSMGFEGGLGTWADPGGCTISDSTVRFHSTASSMLLTATGAGDMTARSCAQAKIMAQGLPCQAGATISGSAWYRANTTGRTVRLYVSFYAADGSFIITPQIATGTDVNTGWTQLTGSTVAPAGAARVRLNVYVVAAAGAGEGHFVDDVSLSSDKVVITEILPMVPIQVQATWNSLTYNLFTGYATSWADAGLNIPGYAETTLTATDGLYVLAGVTLPTSSSPVGTGENACDRVARLLDFAGWPAGQRSIDECDTVIQGTTLGDTALNLINNTTQTEVGEFYIDGSGNAVFRRRNAILQDTRSTVPQMVLGDQPGNAETDGTELPYSVAISSSDDVNMFNDIQATSVGGTMQEAIDDASVSQYQFPRVYSNSELLYLDDGTTLAWAQYVLLVASQAIERFDTVTLMPRRDPGDLFPQVLGREVGDLIEVWRRPPNVAAFTRQCLIRSIDHTWDSDTQNWQTVWGLQLASNAGSGSIGGGGGGFSFLVLDDPVRGTLDQNSLSF